MMMTMIASARKTFQWKVLSPAREQPLKYRQRAADVHCVGIKQPLDLQAVGRGYHQGGRVKGVDVRCDPARLFDLNGRLGPEVEALAGYEGIGW